MYKYGFKKVKIMEEKIPNSTWLYKDLVHNIKIIGYLNEMIGSKGNVQVGFTLIDPKIFADGREPSAFVEFQKGNKHDNMYISAYQVNPFLQLIEDITGEEYLLSRKLSKNGRDVYK